MASDSGLAVEIREKSAVDPITAVALAVAAAVVAGVVIAAIARDSVSDKRLVIPIVFESLPTGSRPPLSLT